MEYKNIRRFSRLYRNKFGVRPKSVIVQTKIDYAVQLLQKKPELSCYEIAQAIGKEDEKGLNFFFNTHYICSPRMCKNKEQK